MFLLINRALLTILPWNSGKVKGHRHLCDRFWTLLRCGLASHDVAAFAAHVLNQEIDRNEHLRGIC
ncbi:MAG: hypothetical protein AAGD43_13355 [Pseudomonadota bacterium]